MEKERYFFFSSRRRHTRYIGDWSSDVCSSDLQGRPLQPAGLRAARRGAAAPPGLRARGAGAAARAEQIGRASCRERVWSSVGGAAVGKNVAGEGGERWRRGWSGRVLGGDVAGV